jgi:NDP-sugar pyrophosphorylase family protein
VRLIREGVHEWSMPTFAAQEPRLFSDMSQKPRERFLQEAIDRGERVLFRRYTAPLFEIDTPEDLAAARRFFASSPASR